MHQALAHAAKGGVVQIAVIGDHAHHPAPGLFDLPLGEAQELHIVILQPLRVSFAQRLAIHLLVIVDQTSVSIHPYC